MIYTPKLDDAASITLRRLSWAINEPMTTTIREAMKFLPLLMDSGKVCAQCEDTSKCDACYFNQQKKEGAKNELFTEIVEKSHLEQEFYNSRFTERKTKKKKTKPTLCKSCEKKIKKYQEKQRKVLTGRTGKEWQPEMGPFFRA